MILTIDTVAKTLLLDEQNRKQRLDLYSPEAFALISHQWLKVAWNAKHPYTFTWLGRPIIQNPEDVLRSQEVIYRIKPDVILETGVAHGGSLIFYASLCKAMNQGRVIGVDIEIRPQNRQALERHELFPYITLIEGSSTDAFVVQRIKSQIKPGETTLVFLDSNHAKKHVLAELEAYHDLVTPGSYIVATDGGMKDFGDVPRGNPEWTWDNPNAAAAEFVRQHPEFVIEQPAWLFNESELSENITYWPGAWLRRK